MGGPYIAIAMAIVDMAMWGMCLPNRTRERRSIVATPG
jgi:hypothetical protein